MGQLLKVLNMCSYCRAMHGIIFIGGGFTPLNKSELAKHLNDLKSGKRSQHTYHHLDEEKSILTTFKPNGKTAVELLDVIDLDKLQLKYEIHTGFNQNNLRTRVPNFFFNDDF